MALSAGYQAALATWQHGPEPLEIDVLRARYMEKWSLYDGSLFANAARQNPYRNDPAIYRNTRLLWKHSEAVVDFYAGIVYQGALSPEPEQGAIPIRPEATTDERNDLLLAGIWEVYGAWNWQQQKSLRPMYAAALGDCLTEIVDDLDRRMVYPQTIWPGYVTAVELDHVDNVRSYTLEYRVSEKGANGVARAYTYRKEVDGEAFRYFRDDKPWADPDGHGDAVQPNPYGFVPAIWDRHRIGPPNDNRGRGALDGTRQALLESNSIFSHAMDFQRKAFFMQGFLATSARSRSTEIDLSHPEGATGSDIAQSFEIIPVPEGSQLLQPQFDLGETRDMLEDVRTNILAETPEASFYEKLRGMQMVTAPGANRLQGDVALRVDLVRDGADSQTVKLLQMALAIGGMRANGPWWKRDANGRSLPLDRRRMAFLPFDLESFARGELDFTIIKRDLVTPTEEEQLAVALTKQQLGIPLEMILEEDLGYDEEKIAAIMAAKQAEADERAAMFSRGAVEAFGREEV